MDGPKQKSSVAPSWISRSPIDDQELGTVTSTPIDALPGVFERARSAAGLWAAFEPQKRVRVLRPIIDLIIEDQRRLAHLIHRENGKPEIEAISHDLLPSVLLAKYFLKTAPRILRPQTIPMGNPILLPRTSWVTPRPLGVVAVISPWNFPFYLPFGEILMALVAGNSVVFKPSEVTPLVGLEIQKLFDRIGLPGGLLQTLCGDGRLGEAILGQRPEKVFFTGSVSTGKAIARAAGELLIPCNLELGGKNPVLVLDDANLDHASSAVVWGIACNGGQACSAASRVYVDRRIAPEFLELLRRKLSALRLGAAGEISMITLRSQADRYERQLAEAVAAGGKILVGGRFVDGRKQLEPTAVLIENNDRLSLCQEETFGPVVAISTFETVDEAVHRANQSPYGLVASVLTGNSKRGEAIAQRISAGSVMVNEVVYSIAIPAAPWGGPRLSGGGLKHSDAGLLHFTQPHHIHTQRWSWLKYKSLWWFPYSARQLRVFSGYLSLFHSQGFVKLRALFKLVPDAISFLWKERRR